MDKTALVNVVSERTGYPKKQVKETINQFLDAIMQTLKAGDFVKLVGFGKFIPQKTKTREKVDPRDPTTKLTVPAGRRVSFITGRPLKRAVNEQ
ncbi:MAG: HU family DNA-binding protein [Candidatus Bipolaricaulia bacterium]